MEELEDSILGIKRGLKNLKTSQAQEIQKAYHKVYLCHLAVTKISESLKSLETVSPCDGEIVSVAVDGANAKIRISSHE